jgi:hypothetical protein
MTIFKPAALTCSFLFVYIWKILYNRKIYNGRNMPDETKEQIFSLPPAPEKHDPTGNLQIIDSKVSSGVYQFEKAEPKEPSPTQQPPSQQAVFQPAATSAPESSPISPSELLEGDFSYIIKRVLSLLKSKIWVFLILAIAYAALMAGMQILIVPFILIAILQFGFAGIVVPILLLGISAYISYLFFGTIANQASAAYNDQIVKVRQSFLSTAKKTGKVFMLALRILFYSRIWLLILVPIVFTAVMIIVGGVNIGEIQNIGTKILGGSPAEIFSVLGARGMQSNLIIMITVLALGIFSLIVTVISANRTVQASLSFSKLMSGEFISSKDALEYSTTYAKGKWWLIVSYSTCYSLIIGLLPMAASLASSFTKIGYVSTISFLVSTIISILLVPLAIIYGQTFMHELGSPTTRYHANPLLVILTILIFLTPPLITGGAAYFVSSNLSILQSNLKSSDQPLFEFSTTEQNVGLGPSEEVSGQSSEPVTQETQAQPATETQQKPSVKVKRK